VTKAVNDKRRVEEEEVYNPFKKIVNRVGLDERPSPSKGLIRLLGLEVMDCDGVRESPRQEP
jgi:hypothetical protein